MIRGPLLAVVVVGACYSPSFRPCEILCQQGADCPSGYRCEGGVCVTGTESCGGGSGSDGSLDGDDAPDAAPVDPATPWGNIGEVQFNPVIASPLADPSMRDDRLELVALAGTDLVRFTRSSPTAMWGTFAGITEVNATDNLSGEISADGLELVMAKSTTGIDFYNATRNSTTSTFSMPLDMPTVSALGEDYSPSLSRDRLLMVFGSRRGTTTGELYLATRDQPGSIDWSMTELLPDLNTNSREEGPHLSADKLTIYFASDRNGTDFDIYRSTRSNVGDQFPAATAVDELNTSADEREPWVSADGRLILFARTVAGESRLFQATRW